MSTVTISTPPSLTVAPVSEPKVKLVVRALKLSEYKQAARVLAEAFFDDDVGRYFLDTPARAHWTDEQKWALHLNIFEYLTYAHILAGLGTTAGDDYGCVALWMPPNTSAAIDTLYTTLRSGLWRLHYQLCAEARHRFFTEFFPLLHHTKTSILGPRDDEAYYLVYLGTKASCRGQGLARAVIEEQMVKADRDGRVSYLESSNVVNLGFYGRLGFEVVRHVELDRGQRTVKLDCMTREPKVVRDVEETPTSHVKVARDSSGEAPAVKQPIDRKSEKIPKIEITVVKDVKRQATAIAIGEKMVHVAGVEEVVDVSA